MSTDSSYLRDFISLSCVKFARGSKSLILLPISDTPSSLVIPVQWFYVADLIILGDI